MHEGRPHHPEVRPHPAQVRVSESMAADPRLDQADRGAAVGRPGGLRRVHGHGDAVLQLRDDRHRLVGDHAMAGGAHAAVSVRPSGRGDRGLPPDQRPSRRQGGAGVRLLGPVVEGRLAAALSSGRRPAAAGQIRGDGRDPGRPGHGAQAGRERGRGGLRTAQDQDQARLGPGAPGGGAGCLPQGDHPGRRQRRLRRRRHRLAGGPGEIRAHHHRAAVSRRRLDPLRQPAGEDLHPDLSRRVDQRPRGPGTDDPAPGGTPGQPEDRSRWWHP